MKTRVCPKCKRYNPPDEWRCIRCGENLVYSLTQIPYKLFRLFRNLADKTISSLKWLVVLLAVIFLGVFLDLIFGPSGWVLLYILSSILVPGWFFFTSQNSDIPEWGVLWFVIDFFYLPFYCFGFSIAINLLLRDK